MTTLIVETADLADAAHVLSDQVGEPLWTSVSSALDDAASCTGMAGDDPAGAAWAREYEPAARRAARAAQDVLNGVFRLSSMLAATAENYASADRASTTGERRAVGAVIANLPVPAEVTLTTRFEGAGGGASGAPYGWSLIQHYVGLAWPNGHQDRLRSAAAAWDRSANALSGHAFDVELAALDAIRDDLPEWHDIRTACWSLAGHVREVARAHRSLGRACTELAHHLDVAHSKVEHELTEFLAESAAIEAAGAALSIFTAGAAEAPTQAAETARISTTVARVVSLLTEFGTAVREVVLGLPLVAEISARVSSALDRLLSIRIVAAEVAGVPGLRVLSIARDGRTVGGAADSELGALTRLETNATEIGEGGGAYVRAPKHVDISDPKTFDPETIKGMDPEHLRSSIPKDWKERPTGSGDGMVYTDPLNRGRQIRIMPGYDPSVRPGLINHGPYAVVSQNSSKVKIALEGNGTLG